MSRIPGAGSPAGRGDRVWFTGFALGALAVYLLSPITEWGDSLHYALAIEAGDPVDAARALGYVHAQERYFEMDLMRRTSAGELAALFGARALPLDRRHRLHRMRARAKAGLDAFAGDHVDVAGQARDARAHVQ